MIKNINILNKTAFFQGISSENMISIVNSHICYIKKFEPESTIYDNGSNVRYAGIILDGTVDVIHPFICGNDTIVIRLGSSEAFGESYACLEDTYRLRCDIRAITACTILFINIRYLFQNVEFGSEYRLRLIDNILKSLAVSNINLNTKIQILTQKSLRGKLLTYFNLLASQKQSKEFDIPFNREQLARYLASERSSVCRELAKLQNENIIRVNGRHIALVGDFF